MTIGTTIKALRRERDITQEQLAEYLNVSAQAVSQWETDRTAPDISQLPVLANIFGVTTDRLLGVDITKANEKIKAIADESKAFYAQSKFEQQSFAKRYSRSAPILSFAAKQLRRSSMPTVTQETANAPLKRQRPARRRGSQRRIC